MAAYPKKISVNKSKEAAMSINLIYHAFGIKSTYEYKTECPPVFFK
jgi:hypothetical protein